MTISAFQRNILRWHERNGRDLPWRHTKDPYKILVSEIMLQQTQVSRVIPKYEEFLKAFPTAAHLAKARDAKLLKTWSGLGYWRRARFLKETAKIITRDFNGKFPKTPVELQKLPGIGAYTAGAVACFAFGNTEPFIDTNIRRVYLHHFFHTKHDVSDKEILTIAEKAVWKKDPRTWHYALFDYGATEIRTSKANQRSKHYNKQSKFEGSFRSFRAKAIKKILAEPKQSIPKSTLLDFLDEELRQAESDFSSSEILTQLLKDKLVKQQNSLIRI